MSRHTLFTQPEHSATPKHRARYDGAMPQGVRVNWDKATPLFLETLFETGSETAACQAAGISQPTLSRRGKTDGTLRLAVQLFLAGPYRHTRHTRADKPPPPCEVCAARDAAAETTDAPPDTPVLDDAGAREAALRMRSRFLRGDGDPTTPQVALMREVLDSTAHIEAAKIEHERSMTEAEMLAEMAASLEVEDEWAKVGDGAVGT